MYNPQIKSIHDLQVKDDKKQAQLEDLSMRLNESRHIEQGSLNFGDSRSWTVATWQPKDGPQGYHYKDMSVSFRKDYNSVPIVHVSVDDFNTNKDYDAYFHVDLLNVTTQGFTVRASVNQVSGYNFINLRLNWISFP